jgi:negative regulator of sigma E activity
MNKNNEYKQHLSGFLDNDTESTQAVSNDDFLKHISHEKDLRKTLQRYQYIGEVMRGKQAKTVNLDFAEQIRQKIQAEPPILAPQKKTPVLVIPSWFKPAIGGAMVATVAVLSLTNLNFNETSSTLPHFAQQSPPEQNRIQATLVEQAKPPQSPIMMVSETQDHWITDNKTLESRFNRYLIQHSENASRAGMRNVLPYTNFISYDEVQ